MRILTITNLYPPHNYGGYELSCRDVMNHFKANGHDVTVLTSTARVPGVEAGLEDDVRRVLRPWWNWERRASTLPTPAARLWAEMVSQRELRRALKDVKPDIVSVWHMAGLSLELLTEVESAGVPMAVVVGDDWLVYATSIDAWYRACIRAPKAARIVERVANLRTSLPSLRNAVFAFNSDRTRRIAMSYGIWRDINAVVAHPGVDLTDFPISPRPLDRWTWRILYVGRIEPEKGVLTLIRAFARLPGEARLDVVGRGSEGYVRRLAAFARELGAGDRITFSTADRGSLRDWYLGADVVVFPVEWEEPFGIVPLEAMACGTPVVATGTGGSAEYLSDRVNCLLYPRGDAAALAETLKHLAANASLRTVLAQGGTATAADFSIERYAAQLLALHESTKG